MTQPFDCPHCGYDMEPVGNSVWTCNECKASMHELAIEGIHYFYDNEMHRVINGECVVISQGAPVDTER